MNTEIVEVVIRQEKPQDYQQMFDVNARAFETDAEANLVEALRSRVEPMISLVATLAERVVGHTLFTPVKAQSAPDQAVTMALGPVAVEPDLQNKGIGSKLVRAGIAENRVLGVEAIFVLGHPNFYPRFGFQPAAQFGLWYAKEELEPYFMVLELRHQALASLSGFAEYRPEFNED